MSVNMPQDSTLLLNIPSILKDKNNWVNWGVDKKNIKCPYDPKSLAKASAGDPSTWGRYTEAVNNVKSGKALGVGFEFDGSGIYGIDLDTVRDPDTGAVAPEALEIITALDCYCEISPSGYGLHLYCIADIELAHNKTSLPQNSIKRPDIDAKTDSPKLDNSGKQVYKIPEIEIYSDKRFFTVTGQIYGKVKGIERRSAELQQIYDKYFKHPEEKSKTQPVINGSYEDDRRSLAAGLQKGTNLISIWSGNRQSSDESANDAELMNKLAYWCNGNSELMIDAFFSSPFYEQKDQEHKKKCDRDDYIDRTVKYAMSKLVKTAREDSHAYKLEQAKNEFQPIRRKAEDEESFKVKPTSNGYAPERDSSKLKIIRMSEIQPKTLEYLIEPYIPAGTFSIIAGQSGSTKTWMSLYLASIISNGDEFITDNPFVTKRQPNVVIYQFKENDYSTVIRPRLDALRANLDNIIAIDDKDEDENGLPLTLTDGRLEAAIIKYKPVLVILDPLQSYLGDKVDMHRANEVRPVLDHIIGLGNKYNCAFVIIMHLSKMNNIPALDRILGSADFRAAARSICIIGSDPQDPKQRVMAHGKFNNGEYGQSIKYHIDSEHGVVVDGFCTMNADEMVNPKKEGRDKPSITLDEVMEFLTGFLGDEGYAKRDEIEAAAEQQGIKRQTLYNAKKALGIRHMTVGFYPKITWWYAVGTPPPREPEQTEIIHTPIIEFPK